MASSFPDKSTFRDCEYHKRPDIHTCAFERVITLNFHARREKNDNGVLFFAIFHCVLHA